MRKQAISLAQSGTTVSVSSTFQKGKKDSTGDENESKVNDYVYE
jgi:hypothetical protein